MLEPGVHLGGGVRAHLLGRATVGRVVVGDSDVDHVCAVVGSRLEDLPRFHGAQHPVLGHRQPALDRADQPLEHREGLVPAFKQIGGRRGPPQVGPDGQVERPLVGDKRREHPAPAVAQATQRP
ncbi:hypothetical protein MXD59_02150 [Frankia sp. Ag45/Mut15]|uniref:Uncharacterized protein n=1 Tax=Frankia umida TaxID=573489 RepID=A0ABT0JSU3_9ACTN|nr:hypothetical protein [Frankia umida]MCK9874594.1 hypothetical protein [Frankia umida]